MAWTYILSCRDGSYYVGSTAIDVEARVWQHNHDDLLAAKYTRRRRPVALVCIEQFDRVEDAFSRERQLHGWSRAKKRALVEGRSADLPVLARGQPPDIE
jgi:putative endonuclease